MSTLSKLDAVLRVPTLHRLRAIRTEVLQSAQERKLSDVRVFGSVAPGCGHPYPDVDLLVHPAADASVFDLAGFMAQVEELLGVGVDVVSNGGSGPTKDRIRAEAVIEDQDRIAVILDDIARFAVTARRVVARGHALFVDPDDDDQRRIARSLIVDLSGAADRLPESFRVSHPETDWKGIRAVRNFIAHDHDGTDLDILWQAVAVQFLVIVSLLLEP